MVEEEALYVRDGDALVGTILNQGGWDPNAANGGAVLAMLGQCLDEVPTLTPMSVSRFTADLVRPVPMGKRLHVERTVLREGKKIQLVQLLVLVDGVEHVRATALRLREADLTHAPLLPSTTDDRPADRMQRPDESLEVRKVSPGHPRFLDAIDLRRAHHPDGSVAGVWVRLDVPVIAGEPVSPTARLTFAIDFSNLIGIGMPAGEVTMINPDVTAHVLRPPTGEWVALTGDTRFSPELGRGVSMATMSDDDGVFGFSSTSQLIQPRS